MSNKFLPHIAMQIYNTPLMIHKEKLQIILNVLGERIGLEGGETDLLNSSMAKAKRTAAKPKTEISIAVIPVLGTLIHRTTGLDAFSGLRSYMRISDEFEEAMNDSKVDAILFDIDSPGGSASGVFDLADKIYAARDQKPIYAFANEDAYSAAYLIGSTAEYFYAPRTGGVGSIGVRMVHVDMTERDKKEGLKVTHLFKGERKIDFDPHSPLSKEAKEAAMEDITELYDMFVGAVSRYRNISEKAVRDTEAGTYLGLDAKNIGLINDVLTYDEVIEKIVSDVMSNETKSTGASAKSKKDQINSKEEVTEMFNTLAELREQNPDLYNDLLAEAKAELNSDLEELHSQVAKLTREKEDREKRIAKLEKQDFIRTNRETKARIDSAAEVIFTKALANSDIPESMHEKVRSQVNPNDFITGEDGKKHLDQEAFQEAVNAEIADWEDKGMTTTVLGAGFGRDSDDDTPPDMDAEDDQWADETASLLN